MSILICLISCLVELAHKYIIFFISSFCKASLHTVNFFLWRITPTITKRKDETDLRDHHWVSKFLHPNVCLAVHYIVVIFCLTIVTFHISCIFHIWHISSIFLANIIKMGNFSVALFIYLFSVHSKVPISLSFRMFLSLIFSLSFSERRGQKDNGKLLNLNRGS
jgi:hypothetical protein